MKKPSTKPNKKEPRLRGPIVINSWPNIHDNDVRIRINVGTANFGMGSDRIKPSEFPIKDLCKDNLPVGFEPSISKKSLADLRRERRQIKRSRREAQDEMYTRRTLESSQKECMSENSFHIETVDKMGLAFFFGFGAGILAKYTIDWLKKRV